MKRKTAARGGLVVAILVMGSLSLVPGTGADPVPTALMTVTATGALGQPLTLSSIDPCPPIAGATPMVGISFTVPPEGDIVRANSRTFHPTAADGSWSVTLTPNASTTGKVTFSASCVADGNSAPYLTYYDATTLLVTGGDGYSVAMADGEVISFGDVNYSLVCSFGTTILAAPIVGEAIQPNTGDGGWIAGADGGVLALGYAPFYGSAASRQLAAPIVGIAPSPTGNGYWLVARDGGIFNFGDAVFYGSAAQVRLNQPIVGMAPTPSGKGYWLVAADGGIFTFGDATFHGSAGGTAVNRPVIGMAPTATGAGYWLASSDGGVFSFGDAAFHGSASSLQLAQPIVGISPTSSGNGYWLVGRDGGVFSLGDAPFRGISHAASCGFPSGPRDPIPPVVALVGSPNAVPPG